MKTLSLFNIRSRYSIYNVLSVLQPFSSAHAIIANDVIQKCCEGKEPYRSENLGCVYVRSTDIADSVAAYIAKEWNRGYLLEANAGPGILSNSFLQNGIQHLRVFEKSKGFSAALKALSNNYPSLDIVEHDLMFLPSIEFKRRLESENAPQYVGEFYEQTFRNIPQHAWENGTSFQIFSIVANKKSHKFLRYILSALPNHSTLFAFGRCDFFFLISEVEYMCMTALPQKNLSMYRWSTVLYNLFFDIKCLQKFSSNSRDFLFCSKLSKKISENNFFYLIKLTPKADLFSNGMTREKFQDFLVFVRTYLAKRSDLVIKSIEQWIPSCGPRLIKEGMNVFVKFGDLSPKEILWLYNELSSWPEYQSSSLQAFAQKFHTKKFGEKES